ncbi:MAG: prepilin-type N-terminal cleavage/methylation domain-containing protein [Natronospirillum sp.]
MYFRRLSKGFSLIEILVVLIVISVVVSLVALNVAPNNRERQHERYLPELQNFVLQGYTTARLQRRDHGLHFFRDHVLLYDLSIELNELGEQDVTLERLRSWPVPNTLELSLALADERRLLPAYSEEPPTPEELQILLLPDGTGDAPWTLELTWVDSGEVWMRLVSDGFNPPQWRAANAL